MSAIQYLSNMKTKVLDSNQIQQKINRLAYQLLENNYEESEVYIVGIAERGFFLAERIAAVLESISNLKVHLGKIKLNKNDPMDGSIECAFDKKKLSGKVVLLVDDVVNSGKTLIYAVNYFLKFPLKKLRTVVLIDRKHNKFPVKADFVGVSLSTTLQEHVSVELGNGSDSVFLQ